MSKIPKEHRPMVDEFARLTADVSDAPSPEVAERLRSLAASALRAQLRDNPNVKALPARPRLRPVVTEKARTELIRELKELEAPGELPEEALAVVRRDERESLLSGRLINEVTALSPGERLGPFRTLGGIRVWYHVFFAARRMEVREAGAGSPAILFTKARRPVVRGSTASIAIDAGTVWIRGALVTGGLPANSYVGIKVDGGSLRVQGGVTVSGDVVETSAPLKGVLKLDPAADEVSPVEGACSSSGARVKPPDSLTFSFDSGGSKAKGSAGGAAVWGQEFEFRPSRDSWTFVEPLWTVALKYDVRPEEFDAEPIDDDLVHFEGVSKIGEAGLGLPVVVAANPAILGEAAVGASWLLRLDRLLARWYQSDPRLHELTGAWLGIFASGAAIAAEGVAPLGPAVSHAYDLWTIGGGSQQRLPWRQSYRKPFSLFYRCHVAEGEHFLVRGQADLALDRPVTSNGEPVPTPTTDSAVLLHRFEGEVSAFLGAVIAGGEETHQFALRNALVWTQSPSLVFARGRLLEGRRIDAGDAQLLFGVHGWAPTLPDPYVSNAFIRRPRIGRNAQSQLLARVRWTAPETVSVSFEGPLGGGLALGGRERSPEEPRPLRRRENQPSVGLTQVEQGRFALDRESEGERKEAQAREMQGRDQRYETARRENKKSLGLIDGYLNEVVGPAPNLFLLDVSTNQDLLGVALGPQTRRGASVGTAGSPSGFSVSDLAVRTEVAGMRVMTLPQVQWEPVRTLDADQDIMTMGWFPTPLASANDGGATQIGARSQKLMPIIPEDALRGTFDAYREGVPVGIRTTFPFGLIAGIRLEPKDQPNRLRDLYRLNRPKFPEEKSTGGIQITALAEGGRADEGGISPTFEGRMRQLLNGVDLPSGTPLAISVLGETLQPAGSVETVFNNDMAARPRVPVTRIDLSGYGGSNFSDWNNPFAAFAEAAKVQFRVMIGRTALEVIKVNSVLHPWGVRVTRSVTIERRPGGGVIRRDSGWQAFTPGLFDYRYFDTGVNNIVVAPYNFDAGVFRGLFNVRKIRPAPGEVFSHGAATMVPYYFDADVALEGVPGRSAATGVLGYLQTAPNGVPAAAGALRALIESQGPIGGPIETWMDFGGSGLPFRAQRVEVGLAIDSGNPLFVATVRGVPKLPTTGAWSVAVRPVASVPPDGGEAVPVSDNRGVPLIRRYPVKYNAGDTTVYNEPPLSGAPGDYRFADAADLLNPAAPANEYALLQSAPTHAFLFPRPFVPSAGAPRVESGHKPALADLLARSTSKGAFPPAGNTIELASGSFHFNVAAGGKLALSSPVSIVGHPTPLRISGTTGHGSSLFYDTATMRLELQENRWEAEFSGLRVWSDISGMERLTGSEMRIVGSTDQRSQIAEVRSLLLQEIEDILRYIPIFGSRGVQGPIDLGASNAKHELKVEVKAAVTIPPTQAVFPAGAGVKLKLFVKQSTGVDLATGGVKASVTFGAGLDGKVPLLSVGVAAVFLIVSGEITFSLTSVSGTVTAEKLDLMAFVGIGVEGRIGPFQAYAFLGVGFLLSYDAIADQTKYGGLVALEAGVDLVIVNVKIRAELKGLVYDDAGTTKCDYSGSVKIQVDIFLIFSISATYQVTETATL